MTDDFSVDREKPQNGDGSGLEPISDEGAERILNKMERPVDPREAAFLKALLNVGELQDLPDTEEEIERWESEHPDDAWRLAQKLDHIIGEFNLTITLGEQEPGSK